MYIMPSYIFCLPLSSPLPYKSLSHIFVFLLFYDPLTLTRGSLCDYGFGAWWTSKWAHNQ